MLKKRIIILVLCLTVSAGAEISVKTVDFLKEIGVEINAAGPLLVQTDPSRNRVIVANTLSSSVSIIDGETHSVVNIPIGGRALQHLKSEAMTLNRGTGDICLIASKSLHIIHPEKRSAKTIPTDDQFESVAVDESTGNVFIAGRESGEMGFYEAKSHKLRMRTWLDHREKLINLNQTPPPPIRKVVADNELRKIIAIDGYTSTLYLFNSDDGRAVDSRRLDLTSGGRWHLAGYDEKTHRLYVVVETDARKVIEAAKVDVLGNDDIIVQLPEFTEGVGIIYNPKRDEVYVPYDNHPSVHVVDFENGGRIDEIKLPAYGNDASAIDLENDYLYIGSWAHGEIDVIDLQTRKLVRRIEHLGIIPHMFSMAFNPLTNLLYIPKGATAVNGTFGAAVNVLDPVTERYEKIHTGWAPIDLIELQGRNSFLVFNNEDQFAEVHPSGQYEVHTVPYDYPVEAAYSPEGNVYLSYGPHQSYWPTVYIWDAKNGIITIDKDDLSFYDRRVPRQAHTMALDVEGVLYYSQNNWGGEEHFLGKLLDEVRLFEPIKRIALGDTVVREISQRILQYDPELHWLYLVRVGEGNEDPSILQVIDPDSQKVEKRLLLGLTATDFIVETENLYIANFESNTVSIVDKTIFSSREIETGDGPLKLCLCGGKVYVANHLSNTLQEVKEKGKAFPIPYEGFPDNLFVLREKIIITSHNSESLYIFHFYPFNE
ncbi:MAG: hypothetical protein JSV84_12475 [Gemmatimonadota bacterium]|nr:MAG: hypothetical protein JSV84_12475 [Gemmatimonadota bacterium]